ncbi:hypothetical protein [Actinacidiphila sp. bgisy144]|uniref:hypothetical protein n=1 Tax=Actinacidiphila sp. bgisy144 TaxID=3413791 RepID=UPI003EBD535B
MTAPSRSTTLGEAARRARHGARGIGDETWPNRLAADLAELHASWQESAEVCADAAWAARAAQRPVTGLTRPVQITGSDDIDVRTYRHLHLSALRYDFRCRAIQALVEQHVPLNSDPYTAALYAFAFLGQSKPRGLALADEVLDRAGGHAKTLHVLLHGLWLGHHLPDRSRRILHLTARGPFTARTDPVALLREAGALRSLGRFQAALASIDRALDVLPPGDPAVHADFVRERTLICAADDITRLCAARAGGVTA